MLSQKEKAEQREKLYALFGDLPERNAKIDVEQIGAEEQESYILEKLVLHLNGLEEVPAYLARPKGGTGRLPAVLYNHSHGGFYDLGKDEFIRGNVYLEKPCYAEVLASLGCLGICVDHWGFGERHGKSETELFKEFLWYGRSLWGMMVYDSLRAVDYLVSRTDVDASRIATMGMSMGSTMAWWISALDPRIKACVDICCMTDFEELVRARGLDGHGIYYFVPGLLNHFTTSSINALICPRAHLSLNGLYDKLTPREGLEKIDAILSREYEEAGVPRNWRLVKVPGGHRETALMRARVVEFFKSQL
jgi:pimeloyl-ACP methyl ester carboxylesterase